MSESPEPARSAVAPTIHQTHSDDTIRIMLATDNHIGYNERDPIRGQDSINTFREILQLAVKHDVDFILLAGDLFHENRPSRDCLYQVMALLREYTLGDKPVQIELLSDPDEGEAAGFSFPAINYEDPNLNVCIPTFSIHGNHDDPQGAGPEGALCALDLLSAAGLINYMGKFDLPHTDPTVAGAAEGSGITVRPVLLRKGNTRLGLYGIGNVKDARMHFELRSNRVRMYMPRDKEEWFNLLLLHQNRAKRGPQEYVPEGMFDDSIDLVVWGHEHDCRITPEAVAGKKYYITQPGSSVATSLADGESVEKHVALLQIQGKEFEMTSIPLRTVRPFVIEDVVLTEAAEEDGFDLSDQIAVTKFLRSRVNALIEKANALWDERNARALAEGEPELPRMLPLVRLKVDTTDVSELSNPVRFGQEFTGRLANPRDVLTFHRARKTARRGAAVKPEQPELSIDDPSLSNAERLGRVRVHTLVHEYLAAQELQLLGEGGMADAIGLFVEKDDPHAIAMHVNKTLKGLIKGVKARGEIADEDELEDAVAEVRAVHEEEYAAVNDPGTMAAKTKDQGTAAADSDARSVDSMEIDVDAGADSDNFEPTPAPAKKAPPARGGARKTTAAPGKRAPAKGKKAVSEDEDEDEDEIDDPAPAPKAPAKRTNRAAVLSQPAPKATARKKTPAASTSKQATLPFASATRTPRAAASKARGKTKQVVELDSD